MNSKVRNEKLEEYSKMQSKGTIYKDLQFLLNCKTAESFDIKLPILFRNYSTKIGENFSSIGIVLCQDKNWV